jgi:hypothetical protein
MINARNETSVYGNILKKTNYGKSFYATNKTVGKVITDFDDFPYDRFYRGVYQSDKPVIIEREAGYRLVENNCYRNNQSYKSEYPKHCFEAPCSTVYPCYPEYLRKYADKEQLDLFLNRKCVDRSL